MLRERAADALREGSGILPPSFRLNPFFTPRPMGRGIYIFALLCDLSFNELGLWRPAGDYADDAAHARSAPSYNFHPVSDHADNGCWLDRAGPSGPPVAAPRPLLPFPPASGLFVLLSSPPQSACARGSPPQPSPTGNTAGLRCLRGWLALFEREGKCWKR